MGIISEPVTKARGAELGAVMSAKALQLGLACKCVAAPGFLGIFRLTPPLTVSAEEIEKALLIIDYAIGAMIPIFTEGSVGIKIHL
jgi:2,2-dialkylglycine decarboxylase (pyruvate)